MITFAKGVTSGYVPLGGVLVSERIARHFDNNVLWAGLTYSGHPLACAAGCANLGSSIGRAGSRGRSRAERTSWRRYNVFLVAPPLVVAEDEIEEGVRAVDGALDDIGA